MYKIIKFLKYFLKQDKTDEYRHLRIFLILPFVYVISNTILSAFFYESNLIFDLSYTIIIMILSYIGYKKLIPNHILIFLFEAIIFYAILVGYMLSDTLLDGLIFVVIFPIVTIFLQSKLNYIFYWTLSYYLAFSLINIFHLGNNHIDFFSLLQIVFLHMFITFAIGFYIHISKLKTKLLNIRQIKLQKTADRLKLANLHMQKLNSELEKLSSTDELTGLNNRRTIFINLAKKIELYKRKGLVFTLVLVDIDHFKKINDTYGHQVGDKVLQKISLAQQELIREIDSLGRYGGEEFIIILEEDNNTNINAFLERLISGVRDKVSCDKKEVTISAGASVITSGDTQERLIERADKALYEAKHAGRDRFVFNEN